ncbi:hypothetical protein HMH05_23380 [Pseudomonas sp. SbB1]|uniref:hypothetical protein n=1 Tax=Pseudomonas TaxID=286 RepID=UPI00123796BD|nr:MULTISPECIES: hypothetical protein [Pseudomonas]MBP0710939.1 hypothetical protein [Pseudomonas sp. T34]MCK2190388.1 hypothetical protein [Pseudomonas sp. MB04B]MDD2087990.1 hypothetical protein [Pseudomonas putida]MDD2098067.1 hypothetical protein [Pseudomonas putida]NOG90733.1 hypothetical protein [Pseudomonas sp. SbB1]
MSLWAHANLHTDQDMHNGKGSAKEFADVMVVFGDDIVIFSDKHITYQSETDTKVAWKRWYKRAVTSSAKQLYGAKSWLERFPHRVFLDSKCTRPLPVQIPDITKIRFHLVAVTRGSAEACAKHFSGSVGSHMIQTGVDHNAYAELPFTTGPLDSSKEFVHVFDEISLEVLMHEMSTIKDFVEYLGARRAFLLNPNTMITSAGEEQLIASYLMHTNENEHAFHPSTESAPHHISFDETLYPELLSRPEYREMHAQNEISEFWDALIEKFITVGDPTITDLGANQKNHETELALRLMASETRFMRRELSRHFFEMMELAKAGQYVRRARTLTTQQAPDLLYIFLACPKFAEQSYVDYRQYRSRLLLSYAQCAKLKFTGAKTIIALGFDHPLKDYQGGSEDVCVYIRDEYTEEERTEVERLRSALGIYADSSTPTESRSFQFPAADSLQLGTAVVVRQTASKRKQLKTKKSKNIQQKQARKANRKR